MEEKEITPQPNNNTWKIALAIVCVVMLGYGFLCSITTTANLSYLMGYYFSHALIVWVIFYIAVTRKRRLKIRGISFLAIYISMITGSLIGLCQQKQQENLAMTEIQNQFSTLIKSSTDPQGLPKRIEKSIDTTPKASGNYGELERFTKEIMGQMISQRNDYLLELETIGWGHILDANRIKADKTFAESRDIIRKAKETVNKYHEKNSALFNNVGGKIRSLNISEPAKSAMLSGFEKGMNKSRNNVEASWSLEGKAINEFENIINLLSDRKDAWIVDGKRILFYDDNDVDRYNSYMASIRNIMSQQEEIRRQSIQTANDNFDRSKK